MRSRTGIALTAAAATLAATAAWTAPAGGAALTAATSADATVELLECHRGRRAADRDALFRGEMRKLPGTAGMRMRFDLLERVGRGGWRVLRAPGLGVWRTARPDVSRFAYRQRIAALAPGTAYRVVVRFHWQDAAGAPAGRQLVRSAVCRQRGPLPNLRVGRLRHVDGSDADSGGYLVSVVNTGGASARNVRVALTVDGVAVDSRELARLPSRSRRVVTFSGPRCATLATVEVDPDNTVREYDERDNVRSFTCPVAPSRF